MILKSITSRCSSVLLPLFLSLVRPISEYANPVWSPNLRKHIDCIEKIQSTFTKYIYGTKNLNYNERLRFLKLPSLEYRRLRGDLIEVYKITHDIYDTVTTASLFSRHSKEYFIRQHNYKLNKISFKTNMFKYFFTNRVVDVWNKLTHDIVNAKTINDFKNKIDHHFNDLMYSTNLKY